MGSIHNSYRSKLHQLQLWLPILGPVGSGPQLAFQTAGTAHLRIFQGACKALTTRQQQSSHDHTVEAYGSQYCKAVLLLI